MSYTIRPMAMADYDAVRALWHGTPGVGLNESDTRSATTTYLDRNPGMSAVATSDDELVGAVLCGHDGRRGYLHHLAVASGHRRRGIGRALVNWSLERLREAGIHKCNIFLYTDNEDGASFWLGNGWIPRADLQLLQRRIGVDVVAGPS